MENILNSFILIFKYFRIYSLKKFFGTKLGVLWHFIQPIFLITIYTFVFSFIFKFKLPGFENNFSYTIWLILGLGVWFSMSESILLGSNFITEFKNLIKNQSVRIDLLLISVSLIGFFQLFVTITFVIIANVLIEGDINLFYLNLILLFLLQAVLIIGLNFFISPFVILYRDLGLILPNILMIVLFLTPIIYPLDVLPDLLQKFTLFNPFYLIVDLYRQVIFDISFNFSIICKLIFIDALIFTLGFLFFKKIQYFLIESI